MVINQDLVRTLVVNEPSTDTSSRTYGKRDESICNPPLYMNLSDLSRDGSFQQCTRLSLDSILSMLMSTRVLVRACSYLDWVGACSRQGFALY